MSERAFAVAPHPAPAPAFSLTPTMRDCLYVIAELAALGAPPSVRELAHELSLASHSRVTALLWSLKQRGWIDWRRGRARSLVLLRPVELPDEFEIEILKLPKGLA